MSIDAYSHCPGGTGKKIKFCCPDFVPELEKIARMLEGEQYLGAIQHIEQLEQTGKPRECLMAIKAMLLRVTSQFEAAEKHVAEFLNRFPNNPTAWAESAVLSAASEGGRAALPKLLKSIVLTGGPLQNPIYEALGLVADSLLEDGDWSAGRALCRLQSTLSKEDPQPMERLMLLSRSADIPMLLRDDPPLFPPPADATWKDRFNAALEPMKYADWQQTADRFAQLTAEFPAEPVIWHNVAVLRGWLADDQGAIEAWRKYAALPIPLEDAVEAEATAMMLNKDPLGDGIDTFSLSFKVRDQERLQELLLSDTRLHALPIEPQADVDSPPPRYMGIVLNHPVPASAEGITADGMASALGQVLLFGRQTDREAKLDIFGVVATDREAIRSFITALAGNSIDPAAKEEATTQVSASHRLFMHGWIPPRGMTREQLEPLLKQHQRQAIFERWPQVPLGVLDGRTPQAAAADPAYRNRVLAAIYVLEHWCERVPGGIDFNELRTRLGLPLLQPIDVPAGEIGHLPIIRLDRVRPESLSDDDLLLGFHRANLYRTWEAVRKFARAVIERPGFADRPERFQAYSMLAQSAANFDEALANVNEGRQAALAAKRSCASWDLLELSFRFARGEGREAMRLVQHLEAQHIKEPGVAQTLTQMLIDVGLLRPDGSSAVRPDAGAAMAAQAPAPEAGKLWTPGSESSGGGGGKLWTPG